MNVVTTTNSQGDITHDFEVTDDDEFSSQPYERIVVRHISDDPERMTCRCYNDKGDVIWQHAFETREMSFGPISLLGRGQSEQLLGTSPTEGYVGPGDIDNRADVPETVQTVFHALGMAIVPRGEWWLNG